MKQLIIFIKLRSVSRETLAKWDISNFDIAEVAQLVEHILGKNEVTGPIPVFSSILR